MEFPAHLDGLSVQWLTDTLRASGALTHASITSLAVEVLGHEKGLTGELARLRLHYDMDEPDAPRSLIAKFAGPDPQQRAIMLSLGFYEREVRFYEQLAARSRLQTPRCYFTALDPGEGLFLLLLEDLAPARNGSWAAGCSLEEAEAAVRALAGLHAAWWRQPQLMEKDWLKLRGVTAVQAEPAFVEQMWEPFLAQLGSDVTTEILQIGEWLHRHLGWLMAYLYEDGAATLIHNDYQLDNLFFTGTGAALSVTVADWQLTTRGCGVQDVAFFLGGNLDSNVRQNQELRLLRTYHSLLTENGVEDYSFDRCLYEYRLAMLHPLARLSSVIGLGAAHSGQLRLWCDVIVPRYCRAVHHLNVGELLNTRS